MSYRAAKDRLRQAQQRVQSPDLLPVLPVVLPVEEVTGNTFLQVVAEPLVTDVTDVTDKRISHDDCEKKYITSEHPEHAVGTYNIFSSVQSLACTANAGNIGNIGNTQVVEALPIGDDAPVTPVTNTGNTRSAAHRYATDLGLKVRRDHPSKFLHTVVSDDDCFMLYMRAHKFGATMTTQALAERQPCDHLVTGYLGEVAE